MTSNHYIHADSVDECCQTSERKSYSKIEIFKYCFVYPLIPYRANATKIVIVFTYIIEIPGT